MIQIKSPFQGFAEYLSYGDGTDYLCELFNQSAI
jgi:hypothetical protein